MTREFFNEQFAAMLSVYAYAQKLPTVAQDVYWEMLRDMAEADFGFAVRSCLSHCKFFPTIAELIEAGKTAPRIKPKALPEPPATPEQLAAGLKILRECAAGLGSRSSGK